LLKNVEPVGKSLYHYEAIIHLLRVGVKLAGGVGLEMFVDDVSGVEG
jgi:hypothetical protein